MMELRSIFTIIVQLINAPSINISHHTFVRNLRICYYVIDQGKWKSIPFLNWLSHPNKANLFSSHPEDILCCEIIRQGRIHKGSIYTPAHKEILVGVTSSLGRIDTTDIGCLAARE